MDLNLEQQKNLLPSDSLLQQVHHIWEAYELLSVEVLVTSNVLQLLG